MQPIYTDTARLQVTRALGVLLTITGGVALFFLGGQFFVPGDDAAALGSLVLFALGLAVLLVSRAKLARRWEENKAYLLSEAGRTAVHGRQDLVTRLLRAGRIAIGLFLGLAVVFTFLFAAINCGERIDGFCGDIGRPPEGLVAVWQAATLVTGAAYIALVGLRRTLEAEAERIGVVVAEGQRRRRHDHHMDGTDRFSWE